MNEWSHDNSSDNRTEILHGQSDLGYLLVLRLNIEHRNQLKVKSVYSRNILRIIQVCNMQIHKTLQAFTARNVVQINTNKDIIKCCPYSELPTHSESI